MVNEKDAGNWTALHVAAREGSVESVELLLRAGADVHVINGLGCTALNCALVHHRRRIYPMLLAAGAKVPPKVDDPYLREIREVGFAAFRHVHRLHLTDNFAKKFPHLPNDMVSTIVDFAFHVGCYKYY